MTSSPKKAYSSNRAVFETMVKEVIASLPTELKDRLENVAFIIEDDFSGVPGDWDQDNGELLGLYHGISQKERGFWYGNALPDRIIIYRKPLERMSSSLEELKNNIRETVIHEIGHYFGFDEEELTELEDDEEQ